MAKAQTPNIQNYISDVSFPAKKNQILDSARKKNAPKDVIQELQNMPDREFKRADEVQEVLKSRTSEGGGQQNRR